MKGSREGRGRSIAAHIVLLACLAAVATACGVRRLALPTDPGTPLSDASVLYEQATADCRDIDVMTAEIALSGSIRGRRVRRGRLQVGLATAGRVRLEAVAPFGPPAFILAARPDHATLLFPRDDRYVEERSVARLVDALTAGLALDADDLRAMLNGCVSAARRVVAGRRHSGEWFSLTLDDGAVLYGREGEGAPRIVAGRVEGIAVEYPDMAERMPRTVRVVANAATDTPTELTLNISQLEINQQLPDEAFRVDIPAAAKPMTLEELRRAGPLAEGQGR